MYVDQASSCGLPNSATPMSQARIDAQNGRVARAGGYFDRGNQAMSDIVGKLTPPPPSGQCSDFESSLVFGPVLPFAWPSPAAIAARSGSGGGPGTQAILPPSSPQPASGANSGGGGLGPGSGRYWDSYPRGNLTRGAAQFFARPCPPSVVIALPAPRPAAAAPPARTIPVAAPAPAVLAPAPAAAPAFDPIAAQRACRTSNICLDIMKGCVSTSQVTPRQYQACAASGYNRILPLFPDISRAQQALPWIGEGDLVPPQMPAGFQVTRDTQPADIPYLDPNVTGLTQLRQQLGFSGVADSPSLAVWGLLGVAALGLGYAAMTRRRRR